MSRALKIITYPHPLLRKVSKEISNIKSPQIQGLILAIKSMIKKKDGLGLAAPQVGENIRLFIISPELAKNGGSPSNIFANPVIKRFSWRKNIMEEGCLSLPGASGLVKRSAKVVLIACDGKGEKFQLKSEGLLARVIQHEYDHLNGVLFIDKIKTFRSTP